MLNVSGTYHGWFSAANGQNWGIGHASSSDGLTWNKYGSNPVMSRTGNGWEKRDNLSPWVIFNGTCYQNWYAGGTDATGVTIYNYGYAEGRNTVPNAPTITGPTSSVWLTDNRPVFSWTFSDPDATDAQTAFDLQLDNDYLFSSVDYDTGKVVSSTSSHTPSTGIADGAYFCRVKVWDTDDDCSTWSPIVYIMIDANAPDYVRILINGGAAYTASASVSLSVCATDPGKGSGVALMAFSNDNSNWSPWENIAPLRLGWDLTDAMFGGSKSDGQKTVYAKVKDLAGNEIAPQNRASASIFLDRVAPNGLSILINGGAEYTNVSDVLLTLSASDPAPASGIWKIALSNDGVNWSGWFDWPELVYWSLTTGAGGIDVDGIKTVFFKVEDRAQNVGGPVNASIFLDRKAPDQLSLTIDGGAEYTNSSQASITISALDPSPSSQLSEMTLANNADNLGTWEAYATSRSGWSLIKGTGGTDTDGQKTIYLEVRDRAGNVGGPAKGSIFLDRVKPGPLAIMINNGAAYTTSPAVNLSLKSTDPEPASGVYQMQFSDDGVTWSAWEPNLMIRPYTLPGPDGQKTLFFRVQDRAGNVADIAQASIILDTAPPVISNVRVVSITDTSAVITWTTDEEADSGVTFGLTSSYNHSKTDSAFVTSHSIALVGLAPTTPYHFTVLSQDRAGNPPSHTGDLTFSTIATPDTTPPQISGVEVSGITDTMVVVSWSTNEVADSLVMFGLDTNYGKQILGTGFTLKHSIALTGLKPATTYHFMVSSRDPSGNGPAVSTDHIFSTLASPDITPPVISNVKVGGVTDSLAVISWETNEAADGIVEFGNTTAYGKTMSNAGLLTLHEFTLANLKPSTAYHFRVKSRDGTGNGPSVSEDFTFQTAAAPDTVPPVLSNVRVDGVTETSAMVLWDTDEISDSFVEYGTTSAYGFSTADGTNTLRHSLLIQDLSSDKSYHFRVRSTDSSMNTATGGDLTFRTRKTPSGPDTTPPVISGVLVAGITNTRAVVIWQTDELANSEVEFGNSTAYGQKSSDSSYVLTHSMTIDGLKSSTDYHLRVRSTDAYGNGPSIGQDVKFTTASSPDLIPPKITGLKASSVTNTTAVISWSTDEPADGIIDFGLDPSLGRNQTMHLFLTSHSILLTGLEPGKTYHFRITSRDTSGNSATSGADQTFKTHGNTVVPSSSPFIGGDASWIWALLVALAVVCIAVGAIVLRRRAPGTGRQAPPQMRYEAASRQVPQSEHDREIAAVQDAQADGEVETLEMEIEPPEAVQMDDVPAPRYAPAPGPRPAPLRHIRCPRCRTRIPIYKEGPQQVTCPACGNKGPYTPKAVGTLANATVHVRCTGCGSQLPIYATKYPVRITCPACGRSGIYKGPRLPAASPFAF